jgi:chromosome segregation ATPase
MRKNVLVGLLVLVVAILAVGCAKPPQQELDAMKAAMQAAEQAEAPKYAAAEWDKAQQAVNAANAEVEAQNAKFALFRSYTKAKQLIADATAAANAAKEAGIAGKEKAKNEAREAIDAAKAALTTAQEALAALEKCKRKPKDLKKDLEAQKGNLDGLANQVNGLEDAFNREDFFGAKAQAESLKGQIDTIANELANAKTKIKC